MQQKESDHVTALLELITNENVLHSQLERLQSKLLAAQQTLKHLEVVNTVYIQKFCISFDVEKVDHLSEQLLCLKDKLSKSSSTLMVELSERSFFGCFEDIADMCSLLYRLKRSRTFYNLSQKALRKKLRSNTPGSLLRSSAEDSFGNCPSREMCDEDENSDVVTETLNSISYFELIVFLATTCRDQYKSWLELVMNNATLADVTRYSREYEIVWDDIKDAAEIFGIPITAQLLPALQWLEQLDSNKKRVDHVEKILYMPVFNIQTGEGGLIKAIQTFRRCFSNPNTVTLSALADTMLELNDLLSNHEKPDNWWDMIEQLSKATDLIKFLSESVDDDFRNLIDAVEERSEQTIDESTVSDLIRVKQFLQPVFRKRKFSEPHEFLTCLMKSLQKETNVSARINNCAHHLHGLKALYQHVANRGELTKEIIKNAMMGGCYEWLLKKGMESCHMRLTYTISKKTAGKAEEFSYDTEDMNDLKSRALLISTADKGDKDVASFVPVSEKSMKDLADFISIVTMVQDIGQIVTELHRLGHFNYIAYHSKLSYSLGLKSELTNLQRSLSSELQCWKSDLHRHRLEFLSLNYIFSVQLSALSSFLLKTGNRDVDQSVENIVHFVHPGVSKDELKNYCDVLPSTTVHSAAEKLRYVGSVLDAIKSKFPCHRKLFPQTNELVKTKNVNAIVQSDQLFIVQLEMNSPQTVPVMLSLYAHTMGYYPFPNEVLFCHSTTTWEEIYLIIQRCIRMKNQELHCIANVERLTNAIQYDLVQELSNLLARQSEFRLAIICRGRQSIVDHFSSFVHHVQGFDPATVKSCLQETWPDVVVITSTVPGLGKTEKITEACAEIECEMKSVHISGPISRKTLVDRLIAQKVESQNVLHLDIGEVDDEELVDASIFELIVLGCLCAGTDVAHLSTNKVFIEVANTVNDRLINGLVVMSSFKRMHYQWQNFKDFVVSNELRSPIQIVCHYLKRLDNNQIDVEDVRFSGTHCVSPLLADICQDLLFKHFPLHENKDLSFTLVEIFLNVFSGQLLKLSGSQFFTVQGLKAMLGGNESNDVRSKLVLALFVVAKEFACRSVKSCRESQAWTKRAVRSKADIMGTTAADVMVQRVEGMLQWQDTNHLLIVFHALESQSVSLLYRDITRVPPHVKQLFLSQAKQEMPNFTELSQGDLVQVLEKIARSKPRHSNAFDDVDRKYAITPDNILKMVLILLRIKANLPVVIMGETGCGKTSLVRYLAHLCEIEFKHVNIHAGTTTETILKEVYECHEKCVKDSKEQLWLFLDEINTCEHMGLLTEIICHHSCFGSRLAKNLVLIAACNPYRLRDSSQIITAGLDGKIKTDEYSKLVYRVHPLPETLIDFVWDYGTLSSGDEKSYIKQMVQCLCIAEWAETLTELLVVSQNFIKKHVPSSSCVSLRDVHRCRVLIEFFYQMLKNKKPATRDEGTIKFHSIILSLAHCYQSRLATVQLRKSYWEQCSLVLWRKEERFGELMQIVLAEQSDLIDRMDLPQGIAKNTALCENVFVILVCILNKIPIFVVGKPGCSKSLSMQLIRSSLRGKDSTDEYFQTLPNLYVVSYQGSESSTSEGITKVFEKAKKYKEANKHENVLPVVLLDEVGLAEVSKFNPLKVLHSVLEPKTGELPNVAVVGISNWSLDAAKMNRAIHLSRPDMDAEELYRTGLSISTVASPGYADGNVVIHPNILTALAKAYFEYQQNQHIKNFHGLRDYYALVKYVSRRSQEDTSESTDIIVQKGLLRNFGGLSVEKNDIVKNDIVIRFMAMKGMKDAKVFRWKIEEIVKDNLLDKTSRHLMIITNADSGLAILVRNLHSLELKPVVIFGSKFAEDQTEEYSYKTLNRIILCMEEGRILVLKDLDSIYGSLYDMLNQNYITVGKKKNCRIALGPYSNPMCQVHDNFRCIVLVDERKVNFSDPPFLNRFEKQLLRFEDIINADQIRLISQMQEWVEDFSIIPDHPFLMEHAFIGINADTVPSLVYVLTAKSDASDEEVIKACKDTLLWLVSPDAVLRLTKSKLASKDTSEVDQIQMKYAERPVHGGLSVVFDRIINNADCSHLPPNLAVAKSYGARMVVFTFSSILVDMQMTWKKSDALVLKLGAYKSEKELSKQLKQFFESDASLLALQCKPSYDSDHIPLAKFLLEEMQQTYCSAERQKHICLVCHMERSSGTLASGSWQFNFLSGWQLLTVDAVEDLGLFPLRQVDNCSSSESVGRVMPLLQHSVVELLESSFKPIEHCIRENILWAFTCTSSNFGERPIKEFTEMVNNILKSADMIKCLSSAVLDVIKNNADCEAWEEQFDNWQSKVAFDMRLLQTSTSFVDALRSHLTSCVTTPLANIIYKLELSSALHSFFATEGDGKVVWEKLFQHVIVLNLHDIKIPRGVGCFQIPKIPHKFECPFSQHFIDGICKFEEFFKTDISSARMKSGSLAGKDEIGSKAYLQLFCQYKDLLLKNVFSDFPEILELHSEALVKDLCNHFSVGASLDEQERIALMQWMCRIKAYRHEKADAITEITETVLCIWQYEGLCQALLRLVSQCRARLPLDIHEMLSEGTMQRRSPVIRKVPDYDVALHGHLVVGVARMDASEVKYVPTEVETESLNESSAVLRENNVANLPESAINIDIISTEEKVVANVWDEKYATVNMEHVGNLVEDSCSEPMSEDESVDIDQGEKVTHEICTNLEEMEIPEGQKTESDLCAPMAVPGGTAKRFSDVESDTLPGKGEDVVPDELRPEERLVEKLCLCLIPTTESVRDCGGVLRWHNHVASVLSFSSSVSGYPTALHELRMFNDHANLMLSSSLSPEKVERYLTQVADEIAKPDRSVSFLHSVETFSVVYRLTSSLKTENVAGSYIQAFLCSYISRCIDVVADKAVFKHFTRYQLQSSIAEEGPFLYFGPIITKCLLESDKEELFEKFCMYIASGKIENVNDNDYLVLIDAALHEETPNRDSLLVLCTDVISRVVFDEYDDWGNLDFIDAADNILLTTCKAAIDVLDKETVSASMRTAAAAAYISVFSRHLSSILTYDSENGSFRDHQILYSVMDALYANCDILFMYVVMRELQPVKNLTGLKRILSNAKDVMPSLKRCCLPEDELLLGLGHEILGGTALQTPDLKQSLLNVHQETAFVCEYLTKMCHSVDQLLTFIETLAQVCYLARSVRPLKDSELQLVTWMKENASAYIMTLPRALNLVQRLTGESSFGIGFLRLTPDSSYLDLLQASVLVHLSAVTIARHSESGFHFFWQCIDSPTATAVKNVRKMLYCQQEWYYARDLESYVFTVCKQCYTRSCTRVLLDRCPFCETSISLLPTSHESISSDDEFCCKSPGQQIARDLLILLIDGCLLSSHGLGIVEWDDLAPVLSHESTERAIANWRQIWGNLGLALQFTDEQLGALLHHVLSKWNSPSIVIQNDEQIRRSIHILEDIIEQMIWKPSLSSDLGRFLGKLLMKHEPPIRRIMLEVEDEKEVKPVARLLRSATAPSFRDMELQLYLSGKDQVHQVLALFFDSKQALELLQHLLPVLKWSLMCLQLVNYALSRAECREMTLEKLLAGDSDKDTECCAVFENFENSWEELRSAENLAVLSSIDSTLSELPEVHQRVTIHSVLIENKDSVVYKVLEALVHIQNLFLDKILTISFDGKCSALGFLHRPKVGEAMSCAPAVKCIHLHNANQDHVVSIDDLTELVQFAQNNPSYGRGQQICYNFMKIEMDLANILILNRAYLLMDGTFPKVVYANELFVSCAFVLSEFKKHIPQQPLSKGIICGIAEKQANNVDYVKKMMRQTEVLLSIVKKTGCSDQTIDSYIQTWQKSLPGGFSADLLPTGGEPLRLSHLVALYEHVESMQADFIVKTLPKEFKEPLTSTLEAKIKEFSKNVPANCFEVALKRFIIRNLVNFDIQRMKLDQPLAEWITEPSLWPEVPDFTEKSLLECVSSGFPKMLNLSHAYSALEFVKQVILEERRHVKWMNPSVKPPVKATAAKPQGHVPRSRTLGKMSRT